MITVLFMSEKWACIMDIALVVCIYEGDICNIHLKSLSNILYAYVHTLGLFHYGSTVPSESSRWTYNQAVILDY